MPRERERGMAKGTSYFALHLPRLAIKSARDSEIVRSAAFHSSTVVGEGSPSNEINGQCGCAPID